MTSDNATYRRIIRRETHSPRTVAMIIVAVILILALLYVGVEVVLYVLSLPPLLVTPGASLAWLIALPTLQPVAAIIAGGILLVVLGLLLIVLALKPGRLARHEMSWANRAVIIDNGVIASSLAQHVSDETGLARDDITVGVAHRRVDVTLRPGYGESVDEARVEQLLDEEIETYQLTPTVKTRVRVVRPQESNFD